MINKQLMLVAMLSVGTALTTMGKVKPVAASLTPPTSYDYSYTWNATDSEQYLNANGVDLIPLYTRTADGVYYNYTNTTTIIDGLDVTMTFNRSNTAWQASGTFWKPDENKIGSNGNVGTLSAKTYIKISNNTNHDYKFYLDRSSSSNFRYFYGTLNGIQFGGAFESLYYGTTTYFNNSYIPSYTELILFNVSTNTDEYLDAWYLEDLGVSDAWQQGYDADTQGILTDYLGTDAQQIGWVLLGIAAILFVFKGGK